MTSQEMWERLAADAAGEIVAAWGRCDVAVVLGSGWSDAADVLGDPADRTMRVSDLAGFSEPAVSGHGGTVRAVGTEHGQVLVFLGRTHYYEKRDAFACAHAVRVAVASGCHTVVLTNAAGRINPAYAIGQPVLITDHLNLTFAGAFNAPPAYDTTYVYDSGLLEAILTDAPDLRTGVYAQFLGPQYESAAEISMARVAGADLAGMSTAIEATVARGLGARVVGISLVTNAATGTSESRLDHGDVLRVGTRAAREVLEIVRRNLPTLADRVPVG